MDPCYQLAAKQADLKALQAIVDTQQSYIKNLHTTVLQMRTQLQTLQSTVDALRPVASSPSMPSLRSQAPQRSASTRHTSKPAASTGISTIELNLIDALRQAPAPLRARSVSPTTRARFRRNGVCVRCGGKGHWVASCPFQPYQADKAQDHAGFVRTVQQFVGRGSAAPSGSASSTSSQVGTRQPPDTIDVGTLDTKSPNPSGVRSTPSVHKAQYRLEGRSVRYGGGNTRSRQEGRQDRKQVGTSGLSLQAESRLRYWATWAARGVRLTEGRLW